MVSTVSLPAADASRTNRGRPVGSGGGVWGGEVSGTALHLAQGHLPWRGHRALHCWVASGSFLGRASCGLLKGFSHQRGLGYENTTRGGEGLSALSDLWPVVACRPHGAAPADFSAGPWLVGRHVWVPASAGAAAAMSKRAFHCCLTGGLILAFLTPSPRFARILWGK